MGETALERAIRLRQAAQRSAIGKEIDRARKEANLSMRAVAAGAGIAIAHLSRVIAGEASPSQDTLVAIATVIGFNASVKLFPTTGPRLRDHMQARMLEAVLAIRDPRWNPRLEVPVWRPVRGVIDLVLQDQHTGDLVAGEGHSLIHAVESQPRHGHEKADALPSATGYPWFDRLDTPRLSRLLVLRSCPPMHDLVRMLPATFAAEYPGDTAQAVAALTDATTPFPDAAIVWVHVDGARTRVLDGWPRGLRL